MEYDDEVPDSDPPPEADGAARGQEPISEQRELERVPKLRRVELEPSSANGAGGTNLALLPVKLESSKLTQSRECEHCRELTSNIYLPLLLVRSDIVTLNNTLNEKVVLLSSEKAQLRESLREAKYVLTVANEKIARLEGQLTACKTLLKTLL